MDADRLSRFPHLSWLPFHVTGARSAQPLVVALHGACHTISLTLAGGHDVRWIRQGKETRWTETIGAVHFVPADNRLNTFVTSMSADFSSGVLLLPQNHLREFLKPEGVAPPGEPHRILADHDPILRACLRRLTAQAGPSAAADAGIGTDEAARRLILRLAELNGSATPDWNDDVSTFERRTMCRLVEYVDEHLPCIPSLSEMACLVGMSPSHFARKFRSSTGLSLHRFVNRRRLIRSLGTLQTRGDSLANVAVDLGFSSQSHFTRLFSSFTGMTPAKYRKQFGRTKG